MSETERPSYYSITPAHVRYDESLKPNEKLLYGEITALANKHGYCWSENKYFAQLYNVKKGTVSGWIANLEKNGYIKTKLIYQKNSKQVSQRRIYINDIGYTIKTGEGMREKSKEELSTTRSNITRVNINHETHSLATLTDNFEKLWALYPRKLGSKKKAFASYKKAIKEGTTDKEIQDGIVAYKRWLKEAKWLNPAYGDTWFNNQRWNNDYEAEIQKEKNKNKQTAQKSEGLDDMLREIGGVDNDKRRSK